MSYFDSPKNEALWNKEVSRLETARENRRNGAAVEQQISPADKVAQAVNRRGQLLREPVTLAQLMAEEHAASPIRRSLDRFADRSLKQSKEMNSPEKSSPQLRGPQPR